LGIERRAVLKRCPATTTKIFGVEWKRRLETGGAYRHSGEARQRLAANPAIIRKNEGKKGVRG